MKKLALYRFMHLFLAAFLLTFVSCQELTIDSQGDFPLKMATDIQTEYTVLATSPRPIVFNISSNTPWTITSDANWCIPTPAMSASSSLIEEISINIADNTSETARVATLTIEAEGVSEKTVIKITQESKEKLLFQPVDQNFPSTGGKLPFTITSNKPWTITSSNMWLTFDITSGEGTGEMVTIQASAAPNTGVKRNATVTISNGLSESQFEVTQDGIVMEFAPISNPEEDLSFSGYGEPKLFNVVANIDWKVETDDDWITLRKVDENQFELTTSASPIFSPRKGTVKLVSADNTLSVEPVTMEITQGIIFGITSSSYQILENGALKVNSTGSNSRAITNKPYKYGTFIWRFSEVNLTGGCLDFNFWPNEGNVNCHLWLGGSFSKFTNGGGAEGIDTWHPQVNFNMPYEELNKMHTLKMVYGPDAQNPGKVRYEIWVNDNKIVDSGNRIDIYNQVPSLNGTVIYFGFTGQTPNGAGTFVLDSFEIIPLN